MKIQRAWQDALQRQGYVEDAGQRAVVERLGALQRALESRPHGMTARLAALLGRSRREPVRGVYLWGGVGRGKTFLMDLFFDTLDVESKRRIHFHRMLHEVHARLGALTDVEDPLAVIAADLAAGTRVLCFDEFFVADIGDAMILGRLLEGLFRHGVTLVTTSNTAPDDLYRDGLQRQRFLPAIAALKRHTDVVHMDGGTDYRLRRLEQAGTWLTPAGTRADAALRRYFEESASSDIHDDDSLTVNGRDIAVRRLAKGIVWFGFDALCDGPRSQHDYIEIARWFPNVLVSDVPTFGREDEDRARRFIALVDEFYDRRVKLVVAAAAAAENLYQGQRLGFEFERTVSRLIEMQSAEYLALPHLA